MDYTLNARKVIRMAVAVALAVFILMNALPSTGGTISAQYPHHQELWHIGSFAFYPLPFFLLIGVTIGFTGLIVFGIMRSRWLEAIGWLLLCSLLAHVVSSL
jgi:hypothetical protein